jgi:hypothetical protein
VGAGRGGRACPLSDQAGQAGVRSARRGRLRGGHGSRRQREVAACRVAAVLGWVRDHGGWSSSSLTPGWAAPEGPLDVPAGLGVRPQRGPSRQRSDLRERVVGLGGVEPPTSSLSGFCPRACFPRIAPGTCASDVPLETAGDRWRPLGSDGLWTKCGPSHDHQPAGPRVSMPACFWHARHAWTGRPRFGALIALIASHLSNRQPRANTPNGVTGYGRATLLRKWAVEALQ